VCGEFIGAAFAAHAFRFATYLPAAICGVARRAPRRSHSDTGRPPPRSAPPRRGVMSTFVASSSP